MKVNGALLLKHNGVRLRSDPETKRWPGQPSAILKAKSAPLSSIAWGQ